MTTTKRLVRVVALCSITVIGLPGPSGAAGFDEPSPFSATIAEPPQSVAGDELGSRLASNAPRWTASAEFILFDRVGGGDQTLVEKLPSSVHFVDLPHTFGTTALTGNDFQGFAGGPRIGLTRHGDSGYDLEFSYFQIDGWNSEKSTGPDSPPDWLVMRAPGFIQTNQPPFDIQAMDWTYASQLHNAEFNVRWNPSDRVTLLAGLRWMNLQEHLVGALEPPTVSWEPPFWNATTSNNLFGLQIGADGTIFHRGRFSIGGRAKAGIYDDNAQQSSAISVIFKQVRTASASTSQAAFVGETGLQCKYQLTKGLSLKAGYEAIWLQGVALAPGQTQETDINTVIIAVQSLGINCNSGVLYHGATAGLEYSF
jgi:hypothetical protein